MRTGRLRHRIIIQQRTETQGTTGEVTWTWSEFATVWASIEPLAGRQFFAAQQVQTAISTQIRIRHREGITAKMRVLFTPDNSNPTAIKYYDIEAVIPIQERDREILLMCTEKEPGGWAQ